MNERFMRHRDFSFTVALCASLVVHAVLSWTITEAYVRAFGQRIWLPGPAQSAGVMPTPQLAMLDRDDDPLRRLGDADASGYATDSSPGEHSLLARQGMQDQPLLSRDPVGPGRIGDPPSESLVPPGDDSVVAGDAALSPPPAGLLAPDADEGASVGMSAPLPEPHVALSKIFQSRSSTDSSPSATFAGVAQSVVARPGPQHAADPAPQGQSESDPVSMLGSVEFRVGSTIARLGRKHKITRPRWTLENRVDLAMLGSAQLVLKLRTDPAGNVTSAEVARSSGSSSVDQIVKVTAYEWWFDAPVDASGTPRADAFLFTIRIN